MAQGFDGVVRIVGYVHKLVFAALCFGAVGDVGYAYAGGCGELQIVEVREGGVVAWHADDAVAHGCAVGAEQMQWVA